MKWLSLLLVVSAFNAFGQEAQVAEPEFDSLGGNRMLLERAKAMDPDQDVSVVQNRAVNRRNRFEFAPEVSGTLGGDTYTRTRSVGLNAYYHITPRWAVGAKFNYAFNSLTPEGQSMLDLANEDFLKDPENPDKPFAEPDYPKTEYMALINWFPMYGKFSLLDKKIIHFDFYAVAGAGQTQLKSGGATTFTGGGGVGLWFTQHFTTRMEFRYQTYTGKYKDTPRRLDLTVASLQMGWLL